MDRDELKKLILEVLNETEGKTAKEIRKLIKKSRRADGQGVTKKEVNSVLYRSEEARKEETGKAPKWTKVA